MYLSCFECRLDDIKPTERFWSMDETSRLVSQALDHIGYGSQMVRFRRDCWQQYALLENDKKYHRAGRHLILAGSKAEGVTAFYENDIDHLYILKDVMCVNGEEGLSYNASTVFQTDTHNAPPGYTKLKLVKLCRDRNTDLNMIKSAMFKDADDNTCISSTFYMAEQRKEVQGRQSKLASQNTVSYGEAAGPALPLSTSSLKVDVVTGICYLKPKVLQAWAKRNHTNGWPSSDVIKDIATRDCQVVPIGCRDTDTQFQDWRMCFIDSELQLIQCLNTSQIKHYIILKQITRDILKLASEEITSFIVKNVCFWMAELLPSTIFREEKLIEMCIFSLTFLKHCISSWNNLPYYMIPERNLLAGKISHTDRRQLCSLLDELIMEGPRLVMRCTKIRLAMTAMYNIPGQLSVYSKKRDELESLKLQHALANLARAYGEDTDGICDNLRFKMADIVLPEWKFMRHVGSDVKDIISDRVKQWLS
ncbi:uncharacterized protein LOC123533896 isoform X2 [Mercenaria mercenaria]|uniref:uncharacterized protein LOC123533896 isoform X2 n=1 Tax=Mercenaria mercenaria TaxID=6596 RepID=UPI00234F8475|nr:uncharacterized protein LOC123533896 isoform X2 [Mercenaria mercenaria]